MAVGQGWHCAKRSCPPFPPPSSIPDLGQVVALITLGSPHHFPKLLPNQQLSRLVAGPPSNATAAAQAASAAAAAAVPRANIAAGAADYFLPHTLGSAGAPVRPGEQPELSLLMRDMPGVWTTCGHKVSRAGGVGTALLGRQHALRCSSLPHNQRMPASRAVAESAHPCFTPHPAPHCHRALCRATSWCACWCRCWLMPPQPPWTQQAAPPSGRQPSS